MTHSAAGPQAGIDGGPKPHAQVATDNANGPVVINGGGTSSVRAKKKHGI